MIIFSAEKNVKKSLCIILNLNFWACYQWKCISFQV